MEVKIRTIDKEFMMTIFEKLSDEDKSKVNLLITELALKPLLINLTYPEAELITSFLADEIGLRVIFGNANTPINLTYEKYCAFSKENNSKPVSEEDYKKQLKLIKEYLGK